MTTDSTLADLTALSEEQIRVAFKSSQDKRAKWRGLMRIVAAALSGSYESASASARPPAQSE